MAEPLEMCLNVYIHVTDNGGTTPGLTYLAEGAAREHLRRQEVYEETYGPNWNELRQFLVNIATSDKVTLAGLSAPVDQDVMYNARGSVLDALKNAGLENQGTVATRTVLGLISKIVGDVNSPENVQVVAAAVAATYVIVLGRPDGTVCTQTECDALTANASAAGLLVAR